MPVLILVIALRLFSGLLLLDPGVPYKLFLTARPLFEDMTWC